MTLKIWEKSEYGSSRLMLCITYGTLGYPQEQEQW